MTDLEDLPELDVDRETAEAIRTRAHALMTGGQQGAWRRLLRFYDGAEPAIIALAAAVYLLWATTAVAALHQ